MEKKLAENCFYIFSKKDVKQALCTDIWLHLLCKTYVYIKNIKKIVLKPTKVERIEGNCHLSPSPRNNNNNITTNNSNNSGLGTALLTTYTFIKLQENHFVQSKKRKHNHVRNISTHTWQKEACLKKLEEKKSIFRRWRENLNCKTKMVRKW